MDPFIDSSIFSKLSINPGAIIETKAGIKISITIVRKSKPKNKRLRLNLNDKKSDEMTEKKHISKEKRIKARAENETKDSRGNKCLTDGMINWNRITHSVSSVIISIRSCLRAASKTLDVGIGLAILVLKTAQVVIV